MKFGSVCSGIEAASVAWHPLGWKAAWLAEIEPFPSAVLAHHYPEVPNLGDMTALPERIASGEVEAPDVFCGGTPCQAFSVAGLRKSLDDARGNLSLTFCEIADAIDHVRSVRGEQPTIVFWENVPGVLSTKDNAFGCFLAGLAGEDGELVAPGGKWANAGCVYGPSRAVAWRVFDAQYFGVAQRRRRVFVVASARAGFDPAAVLFESDGVRRDTAPRREAGQAVAATLDARTKGGGFPGTDGAVGGHVVPITMAHGQGGAEIGFDCGPTLTCNHEAPIAAYGIRTANTSSNGWGIQEEATHTLDGAMGIAVAHTLRGEGFDASEDGTGRGTPLVPVSYAIQAGALRTNPASGPDGMGVQADHAYTLEARAEVQAVAVALRGREGGATAELGDEVQNCLRASSGGGDKPHVLAPAVRDISQTLTSNYGKQVDSSDTALGPNVVFPAMQVRRLTPRECERLQGFQDSYTQIASTTVTHRKGCEFFGTKEVVAHGTDRAPCGCKAKHTPAKQCPDGPRYKALGNSWAVPVVRWIGARIQAALMQAANDNSQQCIEVAA